MKRVYFAHCMADYGNAREQMALGLIAEKFPGWEIVNPSDQAISNEFNKWRYSSIHNETHPMEFWTDIVRTCDALVFLFNGSSRDNLTIGAGVAQEALSAHVLDLPVFEISIVDLGLDGLGAGIAISQQFFDILTIDETRGLIAEQKSTTENGRAERVVEAEEAGVQ